MLNVDALRQFFSVQGAAWTSTCILALFVVRMWNASPAMFAQWIAYRRLRAEERTADWTRRGDEIKRLSDAEQRCVAELLDVKKRLATLEGYQIGRGQAAQDVTIFEGSKRLDENGKHTGGNGK
jgi:hypothetical protein